MANDSSAQTRELVALIRADGRGELRDGGHITRMRAPNADELRGMVMERAIAIAMDGGEAVRVRTIDVDGVYPLIIDESGRIEQGGDITPLAPNDTDLTPEETLGVRPAEASEHLDPHESIRLPRSAMMAALARGGVAPREVGRDDQAATDPEAERIAAIRERAEAALAAESRAAEGDEVSADDAAEEPVSLATQDVPLLFDEPLDEFDLDDDEHAEELDFAAAAADAQTATAGEVAPDAIDEDDLLHEVGLDHEFDPPAEAVPSRDWAPVFPRSRADKAAQDNAAQDTAASNDSVEDDAVDAAAEDAAGGEGQLLSGDATATDVPGPASPIAEPATEAEPAHPRNPGSHHGPTLDDFLAERADRTPGPAQRGWRAGVRRATGGLVKLSPGKREQAERDEIAAIQRPFDGTRTIVVVNPKGGAHKTTATLMIAAMFGTYRGGYTLAWDNNETRGTLAWRSKPGNTRRTAVDLLEDLPRFEISGGASIHDIDQYVRGQGDAKFDVLASDDDAASAAIIDDDAFSRLHRVLSRFYRVMVIDTGNNMRASNWEAALDTADQLVIVSTAREDTAASAAWLADGLRERGYGELLANAVTILSSPSAKEDPELTQKLRAHFQRLTRALVEVPYDQEFVGGGELDIPRLRPETRAAWRRAAAVIAEGL